MLSCKHKYYRMETSPPETVLVSFVLLLTKASPSKDVNFRLISNQHNGFCHHLWRKRSFSIDMEEKTFKHRPSDHLTNASFFYCKTILVNKTSMHSRKGTSQLHSTVRQFLISHSPGAWQDFHYIKSYHVFLYSLCTQRTNHLEGMRAKNKLAVLSTDLWNGNLTGFGVICRFRGFSTMLLCALLCCLRAHIRRKR